MISAFPAWTTRGLAGTLACLATLVLAGIFVGIQDFQRKAGLLPGGASPQK